MEIAVLVKVVPAAEAATFDPLRKTIRRDEGELFVNPFDQRAIRVALDLRRPGRNGDGRLDGSPRDGVGRPGDPRLRRRPGGPRRATRSSPAPTRS